MADEKEIAEKKAVEKLIQQQRSRSIIRAKGSGRGSYKDLKQTQNRVNKAIKKAIEGKKKKPKKKIILRPKR